MNEIEDVTLEVAGQSLCHTACSLSESAEEDVARNASFDLAYIGKGLPCRKNDEAVVKIGGELWCTGIIRNVRPSHDGNSRSYAVTVVSKVVDATESSIDHATGHAKNVDLDGIAKTFDTAGVGVVVKGGSLKKPHHKVRIGETLFETLETDARSQGFLIYDQPDGKMRLQKGPEGRHSGGLVLGENIEDASADISGDKDFDEIKVRGQATVGTDRRATGIEAKAKGITTGRSRKLIVLHDGEATPARLKERAAWEAKRAAGNAISCNITTPGWRDKGGELYKRNYLIFVDDEWIGITQDMVISNVVFRQGSDGDQAVLTLKDPRALGGDDPKGTSDQSWGAPAAKRQEIRVDE